MFSILRIHGIESVHRTLFFVLIHFGLIILQGCQLGLFLFVFIIDPLTHTVDIHTAHEKSVLNSTFVPHIVFVGIDVAVFDFEFVPLLPEALVVIFRVRKLTDELKDSTGSVNFSQFAF